MLAENEVIAGFSALETQETLTISPQAINRRDRLLNFILRNEFFILNKYITK
jgi:hypothetical protein